MSGEKDERDTTLEGCLEIYLSSCRCLLADLDNGGCAMSQEEPANVIDLGGFKRSSDSRSRKMRLFKLLSCA